jgi:hypothetical protein
MTLGWTVETYLSHHVILSERQRVKDLPCLGMFLLFCAVPGISLGDPSIVVEGRLFAWLRMTMGEMMVPSLSQRITLQDRRKHDTNAPPRLIRCLIRRKEQTPSALGHMQAA